MKYLSTSVELIAKKPVYLFAFIAFSLLGAPVSIMSRKGIIHGGFTIILSIASITLVAFLTSGVYSAAWKHLNGEKVGLLAGSRKYFQHVLGVSIALSIVGGIVISVFSIAHKLIFLPDVQMVAYGKRLDANLLRTISSFFVTLSFVYAIPAIVVSDSNGKEAIKKSWHFLTANLSKSKTIILCLLLSNVVGIPLTQWAVTYDYASTEYWQITSVKYMFELAMGFIIYLSAAQIYKEFIQNNKVI